LIKLELNSNTGDFARRLDELSLNIFSCGIVADETGKGHSEVLMLMVLGDVFL
jgi:hypothetical protein